MLTDCLTYILRGTGLALALGGAVSLLPSTKAKAQTVYVAVQDGLAIGGYDPVSFHVAHEPMKGHEDHALMWKGAVWLFHSAQNQSRFEANPRAFAPRFGGHCAYGLARGKVFEGDPDTWEIVDGQLYLFRTPRGRSLWLEDQNQMIEAAHAEWPEALHQD
ncbi:MAG: YHS domain-containing (seleno)protein [Pseudomonadota bacterium]|nr:YHS domain-containing (seleno)protein [Pseudomonadota bacterium]